VLGKCQTFVEFDTEKFSGFIIWNIYYKEFWFELQLVWHAGKHSVAAFASSHFQPPFGDPGDLNAF
jgi:hypothetical protein